MNNMNKVLIFNNDPMITFIIGALGTTMLICLITIFIIYTIIKPNIIEKFKSLTINLQKITKKLEEIEKRIEKLESKSQKAELDKTVKKSINLYKLKKP